MWMDLGGIMLSEISQTGKDKYSMLSHVEYNKKKTNICILKKKQTHRYREQSRGYQWEEERGRLAR